MFTHYTETVASFIHHPILDLLFFMVTHKCLPVFIIVCFSYSTKLHPNILIIIEILLISDISSSKYYQNVVRKSIPLSNPVTIYSILFP